MDLITVFTSFFDIQGRPQIPHTIAYPILILLILFWIFSGNKKEEKTDSDSKDLNDNKKGKVLLLFGVLIAGFLVAFPLQNEPVENKESSAPSETPSPAYTEDATGSSAPIGIDKVDFEPSKPANSEDVKSNENTMIPLPTKVTVSESYVEPSQSDYINDVTLPSPEPAPPAPDPVISEGGEFSDSSNLFPSENLPQEIVFDVYCEDNPAFTDYYVEFFTSDSPYGTRYFPSDLPIRYFGEQGYFTLQFFQASTGEWFSSYPSIYARPGENHMLSFTLPTFLTAPQEMFTINAYCEEQQSFRDFYIELYEPYDNVPIIYDASELPIDLFADSGQYKIFIRKNSDKTLLLYDTFETTDQYAITYCFHLDSGYRLHVEDSEYSGTLNKPPAFVPAGAEVYFALSDEYPYDFIVLDEFGQVVPTYYRQNTFYFVMPSNQTTVIVWDAD